VFTARTRRRTLRVPSLPQLALSTTRLLDDGQLLLRASAVNDTYRNDDLLRARMADAPGRLR
jgi:hypothetical protein